MSELFSSLGINWMLLIAQIVNFAILAFVLTKFLYKPIMKMLEERKSRIAEDLLKSKTLEEKIKNADESKNAILGETRKESEKIIKQSEKNATEIKDRLTKEATIEAEKIREEAKKQIASEKEKTMQELKKELGSLVSLSVTKAFGDVAEKSVQEKLVAEAIKKTQ